MTEINGTIALLLIDDVALDAQINGSINVEKDILETTKKATTRGKTYSGDGEYNSTMDVEVLYDPAATEGFSEALVLIKAGTVAVLKFGQTGSGETYFTVSGIAKSLALNLPKNEIATVPISFQGTGEITEATVV